MLYTSYPRGETGSPIFYTKKAEVEFYIFRIPEIAFLGQIFIEDIIIVKA